jgi:hypothetical protein
MIDQLYIDEDYIDDGYFQTGIGIEWGARKIVVPRLAMSLVQSTPTVVYELNLDTFRLTLKDLEDSPEGMPYPDTHRHNTTVTVGGVTLARVIEIINDYVIEFEDGQYAVNLVGANSNVGDRTIVNQVSVRSANSAGLTDNAGAATPVEVASQVRVELTAELLRIIELARIHGLIQGEPLTVGPTSRQVGGITQTINEAGGVVTVTRSA